MNSLIYQNFCGSHSYSITAQCSDAAWIPALAHLEIPSASRNAHTGISQAGISAPSTATLSVHKLVFSHENVSGNGSALTDIGANRVGHVDNSREAAQGCFQFLASLILFPRE